ncbi:MAG TPA: hypothetical protein VG406_24440 [Isosphaeraceae bacterium]|jgi:hypothetical protein|nr:hypothetical protein [Isosphaeraceae bacterium]
MRPRWPSTRSWLVLNAILCIVLCGSKNYSINKIKQFKNIRKSEEYRRLERSNRYHYRSEPLYKDQYFRHMASYHERLAEEYGRAAYRPWYRVEPDPPPAEIFADDIR